MGDRGESDWNGKSKDSMLTSLKRQISSGKLPNVGSIIEEVKKVAIRQPHNFYLWGGFIAATLLVYFFLSSGDFSFLLTYAALWRCFGFGVLNYKIWSSKSAKSVSSKTLELYAITFIVRLLSIMRHQGTNILFGCSFLVYSIFFLPTLTFVFSFPPSYGYGSYYLYLPSASCSC